LIHLKTPEEIALIRRAGAILAALYRELPAEVRPGRTTKDLDTFAESFIRDHPGATPAFKGLYGFPATLCTSVNFEVVHGIPSSSRPLQDGDILSVDCGVRLQGFYADAAVTLPVGDLAADTKRLLEVTSQALDRGIAATRVGNRLGDIGAAIQSAADEAGYGVIKDLVGHGIGREPHEEPQVPNYGTAGRGLKLAMGLVLAIEPMFNAGTPAVRTLPDRWTVVTADRRVSAHFEHTVAVTGDGPVVLTA
jgi:methionyl aminopeptidase